VAPRGPAWFQRSIARPTDTVAQDRRDAHHPTLGVADIQGVLSAPARIRTWDLRIRRLIFAGIFG
jgi:hypothetical protein